MQEPPHKVNALAMGLIGSSFVGVLMLTSPFVTMALRSSLPYMSTPRRKVLRALEEIANRRAQSSRLHHVNGMRAVASPLRFFDLGSGDGETVLAAASAGWRATGIELNSTLWAISSIRRLSLSQPMVRRQCNFLWGDMWKEPIHDADAVMIFGVTPLMGKIAEKIASECRPGTFVMSYRFHIPINSTSGAHSTINGCRSSVGNRHAGSLGADLIYEKDEMRIYQMHYDK